MTKEEITLNIEKNRDLIERALSSDLEPRLLYKLVNDLAKKNEILIKKLNE